VEDRPDNQTRFLLLVRAGERPTPTPPAAPGAARKSLLLVEAANEPGGLVGVLLPFAEHGVNLAKIEARPGGEPWTYRFFLEIAADIHDEALVPVLAAVELRASQVRRLGSYSRVESALAR
jgi:prephenate dehydratase